MIRSTDPVLLACQFIRANAREGIGLREIAGAAHLSERGLQHAFKRQLGTSPLSYLRATRLARAHDDLARQATANPAGRTTTVNEIARRWQFAHPSRFAALYFATYGRYPADTLKHGR
jgi:AraC-like DNA-binding protein